MIVVVATFTFYGVTTFLPLMVAFCPYNTPLSSRKLWGYLYGLFLYIFSSEGSDSSISASPCQLEEKSVSERNTPDGVTGRALDWLIKHSQDEAVVDVAIRAIAGAYLTKDVWDLLAKDSLIVIVAQKFTASFNGALDQETTSLGLSKKQLAIASLHGRALTNIAKHMRPIDAEVGHATGLGSGLDIGPGVRLTPDQIQPVERGLFQ
jgi:hypothetical protein